MAVALAALTGCSSTAERPCTAIGGRIGIGLEIEPPLAERVSDAAMSICWDGACRRPALLLEPSTRAEPQGCTGDDPDDVCAATAVPTLGKHGFAEARGLPKRPVEVTVTLRAASGKRLLHRRIGVTPRGSFPNGPQCGEEGPSAALVAADDQLRVRG